jgi:hypothetical protein
MDGKGGEYGEEFVGQGGLGWKVSVPQLTLGRLRCNRRQSKESVVQTFTSMERKSKVTQIVLSVFYDQIEVQQEVMRYKTG